MLLSIDALPHFVREATLNAAAVIGLHGKVIGGPDSKIRDRIRSHNSDALVEELYIPEAVP